MWLVATRPVNQKKEEEKKRKITLSSFDGPNQQSKLIRQQKNLNRSLIAAIYATSMTVDCFASLNFDSPSPQSTLRLSSISSTCSQLSLKITVLSANITYTTTA